MVPKKLYQNTLNRKLLFGYASQNSNAVLVGSTQVENLKSRITSVRATLCYGASLNYH